MAQPGIKEKNTESILKNYYNFYTGIYSALRKNIEKLSLLKHHIQSGRKTLRALLLAFTYGAVFFISTGLYFSKFWIALSALLAGSTLIFFATLASNKIIWHTLWIGPVSFTLFSLGAMEGQQWALFWTIAGIPVSYIFSRFFWNRIQKMHEFNVKRCIRIIQGILSTAFFFATMGGIMGIIGEGLTDDALGIMAMASIYGSFLGMYCGLRWVPKKLIKCSFCGEQNKVPEEKPDTAFTCRKCGKSI